MNNASGHQVKFKKQLQRTESTSVFTLKKDKVVIQEVYKSRVEVFIGNGTMKMMHIQRNDSGQYSIEIFSPNGLYLKNIQLTLDVQGKYLSFIPKLIKSNRSIVQTKYINSFSFFFFYFKSFFIFNI